MVIHKPLEQSFFIKNRLTLNTVASPAGGAKAGFREAPLCAAVADQACKPGRGARSEGWG
jgi:hypothetical protein